MTTSNTSGSYSLTAKEPTLYLVYGNGHSTFYLNVRGSVPQQHERAVFDQKYNVAGQLLWSAANRTANRFYIGSNVTKIAIAPNARANGESVQFSR